MNGMEITQFTYFQQCGGYELPRIACELTYGVERLAMYLQEVESVYDLVWTTLPSGQKISYGDVHKRDEFEWSHYNFNVADVEMCKRHFDELRGEAESCLDKGFVLPAYDYTLKCSHTFNLLDARGAISVTERADYIRRIRDLARACAKAYWESREAQGWPMLQGPRAGEDPRRPWPRARAARRRRRRKRKPADPSRAVVPGSR